MERLPRQVSPLSAQHISDVELRRQFNYAKDKGWLPAFSADNNYDVAPHVLMAIASRETNMRTIRGDGGHGHGLMQIDDRSFPAWCRSGKWRIALEGIHMGAFVLRSKYNYVESKGIPSADILKVAIAAYNVGAPPAIEDYKLHHDPDLRTTDGNYSSDVLARAPVFAKLLSSNA